MKKFSFKKIALVVASLALVAVLAVGATLAWFTDSQEAHNVVTFGNVKISLTEPNFAFDKEEDGKLVKIDVVPGEEISKDPTIQNTGNNACYVRAKVEISGDLLDVKTEDEIRACLDIQDGWTYNAEDGYYYYSAVLDPNSDAIKLFTTVTLPKAWSNEVANKTFNIDVTAEAVQSQNFDASSDWATVNA